MIIILNAENSQKLLEGLHQVVREQKLMNWLPSADGQFALFRWPTRHADFLLRATANPPQKRVTLLLQARRPSISKAVKVQHIDELINQVQLLFPNDITSIEIADMSSILQPKYSKGV